jgi:hypothetical protein
MAVRGLYVENGNLVLKSENAPALSNVPAVLARAGVTLEQIKVEAADEKIPAAPLLQLAEELLKFFARTVYPDTERTEEFESATVRVGRRVFNLRASESVLILTYSHWNGRTDNPIVHRGRWILNPARALALAKEIISAAKENPFNYKLSDDLILMKDSEGYKLLNTRRAVTSEFNKIERILLSSVLETFLLSGMTDTFSGRALGRMRVSSSEGRLMISMAGSRMVVDKVHQLLFLKELIG